MEETAEVSVRAGVDLKLFVTAGTKHVAMVAQFIQSRLRSAKSTLQL